MTSRRGVSRVACGAAVVLASLVSVLLRRSVPIPIGLSPLDDGLFLRSADAIVHGHWLGPYDNLTLSKGPAYPVFIALMHGLGWELKVGEQVTYLLAAAVLALGLWSVTRRRVAATAAYVLVALDPVTFNAQSAELIRDSWHASLGLLFPSAVFLALHLALTRRRWWSWVGAAVLAGVSGGVYWLCREEGAAILPSIVVIVVGMPLVWGRATGQRIRLVPWGRYSCALVLVGVTFVAPLLAVRALNASHYGVAITTETTDGSFPLAYADWTRVGGGSAVYRVPITPAQRQAVYRVSPAAREIEPFLEAPDNPWGDPQLFSGAQTIWAIRDAATLAGEYSSATRSQAYFARLDAEIVSGCDSGVLACAPRLPAPLQSLQRASLGDLTRVSGTISLSVLTGRGLLDQATPRGSTVVATRAGVAALVAGVPADDAGAAAQQAQFRATAGRLDLLGDLYGPLLVGLAVVAVVALGAGWRRRRWPGSPLLLLGLALAVGFATRTGLMALVTVADYNATIARYQLASRSLLVGAVVVGCVVAVDLLVGRRGAPEVIASQVSAPEVSASEVSTSEVSASRSSSGSS